MNNEFYTREELITPDIAREYLKFNKVNRPLNAITVDAYADAMIKGHWRMNGEAICFVKGGALANGQHRLNAVIKSGVPTMFLVVRNCDDDSFVTYDSGRARTFSDVLYLNSVKNYTYVASFITKYFLLSNDLLAFSSASSGPTDLFQKRRYTRQDMLEEYNSSPDLYQKVHSFSSICYKNLRIMTKSEIGGLYVFLHKKKHYDTAYIECFFRQLFFFEECRMKTIGLLRDRLLKTKTTSASIPPKYKAALIAKTWNAYVKQKDIKALRWNEETEGKVFFI